MTLLIAPQLTKPLVRYGIKNAALFDGLSGYLSRTPASSTASVRTMTYSCWRQRAKLGANQTLIEAGVAASNMDKIEFTSADKIRVKLFNGGDVTTVAVFRDPTAFMHIHVAFDLTNAVAADRIRISVNNVLQAVTGTGASNADFYYFKTTAVHKIGDSVYSAGAYLFGGYAAEDILTEAALGAEHFGERDAITGQWQAKRFGGVYGINGFYLGFADASNLGEDKSANGNHWTVNGTITKVMSTPTNVYAVMNPLDHSGSPMTSYGVGNLTPTKSTSQFGQAYSSLRMENNSGVYYAKVTIGADIADFNMGIILDTGVRPAANKIIGHDTYTYGYYKTGDKYNNNVPTAYGTAYYVGSVIGIEVDTDNGTIRFFNDGVDQGIAFSGLSGPYLFACASELGGVGAWDFTDAGLTLGAKTLCTDNLPVRSPKVPSTPQTGSFTGNENADGPFINLGMAPDKAGASTINGNAITWGTHADACATGFKLRTASASYNTAGANTFSIAVVAYGGGSNIPPANALSNP